MVGQNPFQVVDSSVKLSRFDADLIIGLKINRLAPSAYMPILLRAPFHP